MLAPTKRQRKPILSLDGCKYPSYVDCVHIADPSWIGSVGGRLGGILGPARLAGLYALSIAFVVNSHVAERVAEFDFCSKAA
jgi:hypothetical protein